MPVGFELHQFITRRVFETTGREFGRAFEEANLSRRMAGVLHAGFFPANAGSLRRTGWRGLPRERRNISHRFDLTRGVGVNSGRLPF
jgi:hypothetical protein